jgi:hypothetical protein
MMEAVSTTETLTSIYQITWRNISEDTFYRIVSDNGRDRIRNIGVLVVTIRIAISGNLVVSVLV